MDIGNQVRVITIEPVGAAAPDETGPEATQVPAMPEPVPAPPATYAGLENTVAG